MFKLLKKPMKDWNMIDLGIVAISGIALVPVAWGSFIFGANATDKIMTKFKEADNVTTIDEEESGLE